ncbi:MAG: hypothetical protein JNM31_09945 [Flavobacteriales bacterium]|nr:hypothetical protein [Flavobacteriales bacterium]
MSSEEKDKSGPGHTQEAPDMGAFAEQVAKDAKAYLDARLATAKLVTGEKLGRVLARLLLVIVLFLLLSGMLLIGSMALAIWLGGVFGNEALGYAAVAGFYLLLTIGFYLLWRGALRERIMLAVINLIHGG